jgi:quercetin dioxygenase-like cupin family protein
MKIKSFVVAAATCLSLVPCAHAADNAVLVPPGEIKWQDVPNAKGVQLAALQGDPSKGASHFFLKFAPGFSAPVHHHSANHYGTVVSGTVVLSVDGQERKLPAGSYFAFTGKKPHATRCEAGADCVLSIDARGKWDVVQKKTRKK